MSSSSAAARFAAKFSKGLEARFPGSYWPKFLFHYADIQNAVSILSEDAVYSRDLAREMGLHSIDSADPEIIGRTVPQYLGFARLYFRPKTPPLYRVEGFLPSGGTAKHCPVPVYFLFRWDKIFGLEGVLFSDRNLASAHHNVFHDVTDLETVNFGLIYHDSFLPNDDPILKDNIIKARCAEVIVPRSIPVAENLACIVCRSGAERETLLNLLSDSQRNTLAPITAVDASCFHCHQHYIQSVRLTSDSMGFSYSSVPTSNTFSYEFSLTSGDGERFWDSPRTEPGYRLPADFGDYTIRVSIDGHIAYLGKHYSTRLHSDDL
jgi:hypothetical protein